MKMINAGGSFLPTDYNQFIYNCKPGTCKFPFNVPVPSIDAIQLYVDFGNTQPSTQVFTIIDLCPPAGGPVNQEAIVPGNYVVGQDGNGAWYGVFKNFSSPVNNYTSFVIVGDFDTGTYFSEQFEIPANCSTLSKITACYPKLNVLLGYDPNGIYYGLAQGGTQLGDVSVRYFHQAYVVGGKLRETSNKLTTVQSLVRNFRSVVERVYTYEARGVAAFYKDELLAIYARGAVNIDGTVYLVDNDDGLAFELPLDSDGNSELWHASGKFHTTTKLYFGCDSSICIQCCTPALINSGNEVGTLFVGFTPCTPAPANGYRMRYRLAGSSDPYTIATGTTSPITASVDPDLLYEGFLESDCGNGVIGDPVAFVSGCLALVHDGPVSVGPSSTYTINVAANDTINTDTPVFSIISFDASYLDSASIDSSGVITFTVNAFDAEIPETDVIVYQVCCGDECRQQSVSIVAVNTVNITGNTPGDVVVENVTGIAGYTFPGPQPLPFGPLNAFHPAFSGEIFIQLSGTATFASKVQLSKNGTLIQCHNIGPGDVSGTYSLGTTSYTETDQISISVSIGSC